jgi:hypothetical protein
MDTNLNHLLTIYQQRRLSALQFKLYMEILSESCRQGWQSDIAISTAYLQSVLGVSRSTLCRCRKALVDAGLISFTIDNTRFLCCYHLNQCITNVASDEYATSTKSASSADSEAVETLVKAVVTTVSTAHQEYSDDYSDCNGICNTNATEAEASADAGYEAVEEVANDTEVRSGCDDAENLQTSKEKEKMKENKERETKKEKKQKKEIKRKKKEKVKEKKKVLTRTPTEQKNLFYESSTCEIYRNFLDWVDTNAPYVANHLNPITEDQFIALRGYYGSEAIVQNIMNLENRVDLRRRYKSLYLTLVNWLSRAEREMKN